MTPMGILQTLVATAEEPLWTGEALNLYAQLCQFRTRSTRDKP